jgi:hypothetical protein
VCIPALGARVLNEVPTVFLLAIALLAVFEREATAGMLVRALAVLLAILALGIVGYARRRTRRAAAPVAPTGSAALRG